MRSPFSYTTVRFQWCRFLSTSVTTRDGLRAAPVATSIACPTSGQYRRPPVAALLWLGALHQLAPSCSAAGRALLSWSAAVLPAIAAVSRRSAPRELLRHGDNVAPRVVELGAVAVNELEVVAHRVGVRVRAVPQVFMTVPRSMGSSMSS